MRQRAQGPFVMFIPAAARHGRILQRPSRFGIAPASANGFRTFTTISARAGGFGNRAGQIGNGIGSGLDRIARGGIELLPRATACPGTEAMPTIPGGWPAG